MITMKGFLKKWIVFVFFGFFLSALLHAQEFKGKQLGEIAVRKACEYLRKRNVKEVYLDCVQGSGFLPSFYEKLGFERIARKTVNYPIGAFDMVLMRRKF